jgi:hypothetical protein
MPSLIAGEKLAARLAESEAAIVERRSAAEALALNGGDDAALDVAENRLRASMDRVATLQAAIISNNQQIASLEAERDMAADKKQRRETSAEVEKMASNLEEIGRDFDPIISRLIDVTERAKMFLYEAGGLHMFGANCKTQVPDAVVVIAGMLRAHAASVLGGHAPASILPPEVIAPIPAPEAEKLTQVFLLNAVSYTDHAGNLQRVGKWLDHELPTHCADRALRLKLATQMDDPRRNQLKGYGGGHPEKSWCVNLDSEPVAGTESGKPNQQEPASQFTPVDRGPGFTLQIAR